MAKQKATEYDFSDILTPKEEYDFSEILAPKVKPDPNSEFSPEKTTPLMLTEYQGLFLPETEAVTATAPRIPVTPGGLSARNRILAEEAYKQHIAEAPPSIKEGGVEQTIAKAPGQISEWVGDPKELPGAIGRGLAEGLTVEIPRMAGQAAQYLGANVQGVNPVIAAAGMAGGHKVQQWAEQAEKAALGERPEYKGLAGVAYEGSKMLAPSIIPAGTAGAAARIGLAGLKSLNAAQKAKIATNIASLTSAGFYGTSTAQDVRARAKEKGVDPGLHPEIQGAIEALGEYVGTRYMAKLLGLDENAIRVTLENFIKTLGVENTTEFVQQLGQSLSDKYSGIRPDARPMDEAIQVIGPTTFMTVMTAGAGKAAEFATRIPEGRRGLPGTTGREFADIPTDTKTEGFDFSDILGAPDRDVVQGEATPDKNVVTPEEKPSESSVEAPQSEELAPEGTQTPPEKETPQIANLEEAKKLTEIETDAGLREADEPLTREQKRALIDAGFTVKELKKMPPKEAKKVLGEEEVAPAARTEQPGDEAAEEVVKTGQVDVPKRVSIAGAKFDVVERNADGTYKVRNDMGDVFDTTPNEDVVPIDVVGREPAKEEKLPATREEYVQRELDNMRQLRESKLREAVSRIEREYQPSKPLPVGLSKVQSLLTKERKSKAEKALAAAYRVAKQDLEADTRADALHHGRVYDELKRRSQPVQEKRTEEESEQKPAWEIAEERVRPYAKNLRNLSDKELRAEDKKISDAINEWARNTPSFLPDGTLNPKIGRDMAYFELSAKLEAIGKEQDKRKGTAPKQPKPTDHAKELMSKAADMTSREFGIDQAKELNDVSLGNIAQSEHRNLVEKAAKQGIIGKGISEYPDLASNYGEPTETPKTPKGEQKKSGGKEAPAPLTQSKLEEAAEAAPKAGLTLKEQKKTLLDELIGAKEIAVKNFGKHVTDFAAIEKAFGSDASATFETEVKGAFQEIKKALVDAGYKLDEKDRIITEVPGDGTFYTPIPNLMEGIDRIKKGFPTSTKAPTPTVSRVQSARSKELAQPFLDRDELQGEVERIKKITKPTLTKTDVEGADWVSEYDGEKNYYRAVPIKQSEVPSAYRQVRSGQAFKVERYADGAWTDYGRRFFYEQETENAYRPDPTSKPTSEFGLKLLSDEYARQQASLRSAEKKLVNINKKIETLGFAPKKPDALRQLSEEHTSSENFQNWFEGSKVVDENGKPKMVFSGHANVEVYGTQFDPKKGTAGAFYATESPEIASNYALGKLGDKQYFENGEQYRLQAKNGKFTKKLWQVELTEEQKKKWDELAEEKNEYGDPKYDSLHNYMRWARDNKDYEPLARRILANPYNLQNLWAFNEEMGYNVAYPKQETEAREPYYMRQQKNDTEEVMDALGIRWQSFDWAQPGVLPIFLSIKNPIDTSKPFPKDALRALEAAVRGTRYLSNEELRARHWTGDYPLRNWVEEIKEQDRTGEDTYWATQVPKKALPILKRFGYDGIKDVGGKARQDPHTVWIAFDGTQVKSATGNNGQFDPTNADMLKKVAEQESAIQSQDVDSLLSTLTPEARENVVVTTRDNAPEGLRKFLDNKTKGIYYNGKVYLFENADPKTFFHELAHMVIDKDPRNFLRGMFGEDHVAPFLDSVWRDRERAIKNAEWYNRYTRTDPDVYNPNTAQGKRNLANEYIAHLSENQDRTTWEKLIAWLRSALRNIAPNIEWTDAELKKLIADGYRKMQKTPQKGTAVQQAPIFRMDKPLFQLKDRKFVAVGIKIGDKVYRGNRGEIHADLLPRMTQDEQFKYLDNTDSHNKLDGFIDDAGQFVSRQEASREAKRELVSPDVLRQIEGDEETRDIEGNGRPLRQLSPESDSETLNRLKPIIEATGGYNVRVDSQMGRPVVYFEHKGVKDADGKSVPTTFARFPETVDTPEKINAIVEEKNADYQVLRQLDEGIDEPMGDVTSSQAQENYDRIKRNLDSVKVKILEKLQDNWVRVDKLLQDREVVVTDENNPYQQKVLYAGRVQDRMDKIQNELDSIDKAVLKTAKERGLSSEELWNDINLYLHAKHAPERNAVHGERASGMSDEDAQNVMNELQEKGEFSDIQRLGDQLAQASRKGLEILRNAQLISEEKYSKLRELYPNHVPLNRVMDDTGIEHYIAGGEGFNVYSSGLKRAKGSERQVADIAVNIATNLATFSVRAEKNLVDLATLQFSRDNAHLGLFEEIKPKAIGKRWDGSTIFQEIRDPLVLHLYENGKPVYLRIKDASLARAFQNINIEKLHPLFHYVAAFGRLYSGLATRFNPEFWPSNKIRDLEELLPTVAAAKGLGGKAALKAVGRDILMENVKAVSDYVRGKDTEGARLYAQMKADGGTTGGLALSTRKDIEINLEKLKKLNRSGGRRALNYAIQTVDHLNQIFEDSTRLSVYRTALEMGMTRKQAAFHAKNSTIDFNRKGEWGGVINALYIFSNASIQGSVKMLRAMKNPKVATAVTLAVATAVFLTAQWNDEIDEDWRDKVSKWDRLNGLPILIPSDEGVRYITIPVSWGLKPIKAMVDNIYDLSTGNEESVKDAVGSVLTSVIDAYNPLGGSDVVSAITPTVLDLPVDLARNKTWSGSMIRPHDYGARPRYTLYFKSLEKSAVGQGAIATARRLDDIGIEVSPADIKYVFDQATGGTGRFLSKVITSAASTVTGELPTSREAPFAGRFYRDIPTEELGARRPVLQRITEQEKRVTRLKIRALETGSQPDIDAYTAAKRVLDDMRKASPEYQAKLRVEKDQREARERTLRSGIR